MQHSHPLQEHPEFSVLHHPGCVEYRVENWRIACDGSRRVLKGYGWSWLDAFLPVLTAIFWHKVCALRLVAAHFANYLFLDMC